MTAPRYSLGTAIVPDGPIAGREVLALFRDGQEINEHALLVDIANMLDALTVTERPGDVLRRTRREHIERQIGAAENAVAYERACIAIGDYARPPCAYTEMTRERREERAALETARAAALRAELAALEAADKGTP